MTLEAEWGKKGGGGGGAIYEGLYTRLYSIFPAWAILSIFGLRFYTWTHSVIGATGDFSVLLPHILSSLGGPNSAFVLIILLIIILENISPSPLIL